MLTVTKYEQNVPISNIDSGLTLMAQSATAGIIVLVLSTLSGCIAGYGVSVSLQNVVVDKAYYYDDYSFLSEEIFSPLNDRLLSEPLAVKRSNNLGLLTGILTRLTTAADFDGSKTPMTANSEYMATAYGYDSRERVSQNVTATQKGIILAVKTEYSGSDLPVTVTTKHVNINGTNSIVTQQYLYDDLDRQTAVTTSVDGVYMARIGTKYDDKGRVASIEMSDERSTYRNTLSYDYLTNGRAKSIKSSTGKFEMTLGYTSGAYPSYSGNVSMMTWKGSDGTERIYNYRYDKQNRLILADYGEVIRHLRNGMEIMGTPDYSVNYSYDLQGNVQTIQRKGMSGVTTDINKMYITFDNVDELTLNYNGNQLKSVTDTAPKVYYTGATDFDDGADEDIEYAYDGNGNMTVDLNRDIVNIVYNRLNLPTEIEFSNGQKLGNDYDADGKLYRRVMHHQLTSEQIKPGRKDKSNSIDTVIYSGPWQYVNGTLDRIHIPGGYIKDNNVYFYILDHQGNIRQVWNATTNLTVQDNHYYPYGSLFGESAATEYINHIALITHSTSTSEERESSTENKLQNNISTSNNSVSDPQTTNNISSETNGLDSLTQIVEISDNAYRYGGKEWLTYRGLNAYDFTARLYDPALGRFHNPDPLNASYPHLSPYLYCTANPINATDPSGNLVIAIDDESKKAILNSLSKSDQAYVVFDENNHIDVSVIDRHKSDSNNYNSLLEMVKSPIRTIVLVQDNYIYMDNEGEIHRRFLAPVEFDEEFVDPNPIAPTGSTNGDTGFLGITLFPGNGKSNQNSIDNDIYIIINKGHTELGAAETFSHEGYGHAYLYMLTQNRKISGHDFTPALGDKNKLLLNRIVNSILETIHNYKEGKQ